MHRAARHLVGIIGLLVLALPGVASAGPLGGLTTTSLFAVTVTAPPDAPTIVMADAFTTAGKVDKRSPEWRGGSRWIEVIDPWKTSNGLLVPPKPGSGGRPNAVVYPTALTDVRVEVDLTLAPTGTKDNVGGIVVRSNANRRSGHLEVDLTRGSGGGGTATIRARRDNTASTLATFAIAQLPTTVRLAVTVVGNTVEVSLDEVLVGTHRLTGSDSTDFATFGHHGLTSTSDDIRFDNVLITDAP